MGVRKKHPSFDAHEIIPNLWQGSVPVGSKCQSAGFIVVVLCAREHQHPATGYPGVQLIHAPNDDHRAMPLTREKLALALKTARIITAAIKDGKCCLVTCAAGMNRSGLVSALVLHLLKGWSGSKCIQHVRQMRGRHRDGFIPLTNQEFTAALRQLPAVDRSPAASAGTPAELRTQGP